MVSTYFAPNVPNVDICRYILSPIILKTYLQRHLVPNEEGTGNQSKDESRQQQLLYHVHGCAPPHNIWVVQDSTLSHCENV